MFPKDFLVLLNVINYRFCQHVLVCLKDISSVHFSPVSVSLRWPHIIWPMSSSLVSSDWTSRCFVCVRCFSGLVACFAMRLGSARVFGDFDSLLGLGTIVFTRLELLRPLFRWLPMDGIVGVWFSSRVLAACASFSWSLTRCLTTIGVFCGRVHCSYYLNL